MNEKCLLFLYMQCTDEHLRIMNLLSPVEGLSGLRFVRSRVCPVQGLSGLGFVGSRICLVQGLSGLGFVGSRICPVWGLSGLGFVGSRICPVWGLPFLGFSGKGFPLYCGMGDAIILWRLQWSKGDLQKLSKSKVHFFKIQQFGG